MTTHADTSTTTPQLQDLISAIRAVTRRGHPPADTAEAVGERLTRYLTRRPTLPERYRQADEEHYLQHLIHAEPDDSFSIVALVWLPGQHTPIHDHLAWCVTGVAEGQESEQRYQLHHHDTAPHLTPTEHVTNHPGDISALAPPGDIHRVTNSSNTLTISLHVYGANIAASGSSIRRIYDHPLTPP